LLLTLIVDLATLRTAPDVAVGKYESTWNSGPKPEGEYSLSAVTFLGNMAFLQTIATPVYGTNGPLWSLANEFWYYVLFPLIAFAAGRIANPGRRWLRLFAVVIAMILLAFMSMQMILGFVVWLMGVVVYLISNRLEERRRYPHLAFSFTGFVLSLIYSKSTTLENQFLIPSDIVIGIAFAYFCVIMARWPRVQLPVLGNAMARFSIAISEFSYSLYLIHFPFVILIAVTFHLPNKMAPDITGLLTYFGWLSLLLILGGIFWFTFERHTALVRRLVDRIVPGRLTC
jgi:peptidoglycan/LPS O-acetylase OafA/YrhL